VRCSECSYERNNNVTQNRLALQYVTSNINWMLCTIAFSKTLSYYNKLLSVGTPDFSIHSISLLRVYVKPWLNGLTGREVSQDCRYLRTRFLIRLTKWNNFIIEWMNVAIGCPIEGKGLIIEEKLIKGSRVELVRMID
jgi:hypothetical protein